MTTTTTDPREDIDLAVLVIPPEFRLVLLEVGEEHERAATTRGFTPEHDAGRSDQAWSWLILRRITETLTPETVWEATPAERRRLLLEVAHIACSAIAAHDRQADGGDVGAFDGEDEGEPTFDPLDEAERARRMAVLDAAEPATSTDDPWRYVTRHDSADVERHVLQCRNWEQDCRGQCAAGYTR